MLRESIVERLAGHEQPGEQRSRADLGEQCPSAVAGTSPRAAARAMTAPNTRLGPFGAVKTAIAAAVVVAAAGTALAVWLTRPTPIPADAVSVVQVGGRGGGPVGQP
jgi:hypothetical protein